MPGRYGANGDQNIAVARATIIGLTASTLRRAEIEEFVYGAEGTPADFMIRLRGAKYTVAGTSTAVVGDGYDDADAAAQLTVGSNHTAEPTYAAVPLLDVPVHLRSTFTWAAREGSRVVIPATAANGFGFGVSHATQTNNARASMRWRE